MNTNERWAISNLFIIKIIDPSHGLQILYLDKYDEKVFFQHVYICLLLNIDVTQKDVFMN